MIMATPTTMASSESTMMTMMVKTSTKMKIPTHRPNFSRRHRFHFSRSSNNDGLVGSSNDDDVEDNNNDEDVLILPPNVETTFCRHLSMEKLTITVIILLHLNLLIMKKKHMKRIRKGLGSLEYYGGRSTGRSTRSQRPWKKDVSHKLGSDLHKSCEGHHTQNLTGYLDLSDQESTQRTSGTRIVTNNSSFNKGDSKYFPARLSISCKWPTFVIKASQRLYLHWNSSPTSLKSLPIKGAEDLRKK